MRAQPVRGPGGGGELERARPAGGGRTRRAAPRGRRRRGPATWTPAGPTPKVNGSHHSSRSRKGTITDEPTRADVVGAGRDEQLPEVAVAGAGQLRLSRGVGVELVHGVPEEAERPLPAGVVPHAGGDHAARPGHPQHLGEPADRVGHEVHDELGERRVDGVVTQGQALGRRLVHLHRRQPVAHGGDERRRRVDRDHVPGAEAVDETAGQRARSAPDVEHPLRRSRVHGGQEQVGQGLGEAPHEPPVGLRRDVEAHVG